MNHVTIYDHKTKKRLAFLQNAFNISYSLKLKGLHTAEFTLPADDPKNQYCKHLNFVEIFDNDKRVELFRILPSQFTRDSGTHEYTYSCEFVLATLIDDILFNYHEVGGLGIYTSQALRYVLDNQTVKRWTLGQNDFNRQFQYIWENENLAKALFSIPKVFPEQYKWTYDTTKSTWIINLKAWDSKVKGEIRYKKNMLGITKTSDPTNICTRLYCLGYGEGDNQLTIKRLNNNLPYIQDSAAINEYGIISKVWVDRRYQDEESLLAAGQVMLNELKLPYLSYEVTAAHLFDLKDITVGDIVRIIDDEDGISVNLPVTGIAKNDITGDSTSIKITIANKPQDIATTISELSDRQRINDLYSQGATNLDSHDFADNCDETNPATLRFYVPAEAVRINAVKFTYAISPFRSYSKGVASAEQKSVTSSGGGATNTTSSAGGGSNTTSSSGGGGSSTSGASSSSTTDQSQGYWDDGGETGLQIEVWDSSKMNPADLTKRDHAHVLPATSMPSHSHGMGHTHNVNTPSHSHNVEIQNHTHSITIGSHTHNVTIPSHTHEMQHGIFTSTRADYVIIKVDGKTLTEQIQPNSDFDIVNYLSTDGGGKIQRNAWHTIEIYPNKLTRIEASLISQLFINSRGKGDF